MAGAIRYSAQRSLRAVCEDPFVFGPVLAGSASRKPGAAEIVRAPKNRWIIRIENHTLFIRVVVRVGHDRSSVVIEMQALGRTMRRRVVGNVIRRAFEQR